MTEIINHPIAEQVIIEDLPFPFVLHADHYNITSTSLSGWIEEHMTELASLLHIHHALLFRNFPINSLSDFEVMLNASHYPAMPYVGGAAPRTKVSSRVLTANESPADEVIPFHHELSQVPHPPSYVFFYCALPAKQGGATPIIFSPLVYDYFNSLAPSYAKSIEKEGVCYTRVMPIKTDATSPIGRSWKETFQCDTQKEAESAMKQLGMTWHWMEDGSVSTKTKALPAVRQAPMSHRKSFFNSIVAAYFGWDDARNYGKQAVTLADGRYFPDDLMQKIKQMMDESSVVVPWQAGDVLWLNNWTVMHARQSFEGERKVYASISP